MPRITKIGNSVGVTIPRDTLATSNLSIGDEITIVPVQDGVFISAVTSPQGAMLAAALQDMNDRPNLFRKLAQ